MKFLDQLARLGILRYDATSQASPTAANSPEEFVYESVLAATRDPVSSGERRLSSDPPKRPPGRRRPF
jgi:hypothetical protein